MMKWRMICLVWLGLLTTIVAQATAPEEKKAALDPLVEKAESLFAKGQANEAYKQLQEATKKNPQLPPAKLMLGRLYLAAANSRAGTQDGANLSQNARQLIEQAISENPEHPEPYLTNASIALAERRITETILNCSTALRLAENDRWTAEQKKTFKRESHAGLATAFENRRDWQAVQGQLLAWKELEPKNAQIRQRLGRVQFFRGNIEESQQEFEAALKENPTLEPSEIAIALLYAAQPDEKNAEAWYKKAIEKNPKLARVYQAYGGWVLDAGRIDDAKPIIEQASKMEPKARETLALKGLLARYEKEFSKAEEIFEQLTKENPADFFSTNQLALVLIENPDAKQQRRAVSIAEINAKSFDRINDVYATLGWCYYKLGRLDEAENMMQRAINTGQIMPDTAYFLARLLDAKGKAEDAHRLVSQALESKSVFVNRMDAKKWEPELKAKLPAPMKK
jgi:tetratricopeptide (TPR) repeat protein